MRIETVVPCVGYDDFLGLTLPRNLELLESITVLTAPDDEHTAVIARNCGARLHITDAWSQGGPFNKARALNEWMDSLSKVGPDVWILTLDADILLLSADRLARLDLDRRVLYGVHRRMCEDYSAWTDFAGGHRDILSYPRDVLPIRNGRVWGRRPTSNPAALSGYFQMWNSQHAAGARRFPERPSAAQYDVEFALSFSQNDRKFIEDYEVLHLGPSKTNWSGRRSPRWEYKGDDLRSDQWPLSVVDRSGGRQANAAVT
jgi:hypothetical protein